MMKKNLLCLVIPLLVASVTGCAARSRILTVGQYEHELSHSVDLFIQHSFPNSMAREPGFDSDAHLRALETDWKERTAVFHSSEGASFLVSRVASESDETVILAILKILHESGQPEAQDVFVTYSHHPSEVVSRSASEYLSMGGKAASNDDG